jgi:hypothetical protein
MAITAQKMDDDDEFVDDAVENQVPAKKPPAAYSDTSWGSAAKRCSKRCSKYASYRHGAAIRPLR